MIKKINPDNIFIFLFLIIFPFGQLFRFSLNVAGVGIPVITLDVVAGLGGVYTLFFQKERSYLFRYLNYFLAIAAFSLLTSVYFFRLQVFYGLFYLVRLAAYFLFFNYVWNFVRRGNAKLVLDSLLSISIISAIFGWFQFVFIPDLKPFYSIGWDMHLYRLAGSFLEPSYLGLIIVFGLLLAINKFIKVGLKKYLGIIVFLLISLAFTYSRASYAAFLGGVLLIGLARKNLRKLLYLLIALLLIALILPTAKNHSIELTRMFSILARFNNYKEALTVFSNSPLLGVGYNNMCAARNLFIGKEAFASHACSGSDSSLLLLLATTGVIGFMEFLFVTTKFYKAVRGKKEWLLVITLSSALFIHSFFSNSLFYPWIMSFMLIAVAVSLGSEVDS